MYPVSYAHLLPWYYKSMYPFDLFSRWLCFDRLVVGLTDAHDGRFTRHIVHSAQEFQTLVQTRNPAKIDCGAHGDNESRRALCFDIDVTDYAEISDCKDDTCSKVICERCWARFMVPGMAIIDAALRQDFGLCKILWIFSGRKGVQCVVWDECVLGLNDKQRADIVAYLSIDPRQLFLGKTHPRNNHPAIQRAYATQSSGNATTLVYPRLDKAVTSQTRHLLKSVFSPHPSSGYIALPLPSPSDRAESPGQDWSRPLTTLMDLETMANSGTLHRPTSDWTNRLRRFEAVVSPRAPTKKRHLECTA